MIAVSVTANVAEEQLTRFTGYPVTLPVFEGPLDLLLYLIRRQEIDIHDIPIARITAQFLDYLGLMEVLDIELASGFLVMAAALLEIKSRMLLPRPPLFDDEEEEEDPRAELVRRLLEYQQFKAAAGELRERAAERQLQFPRAAVVPRLAFARPECQLDGDPDAFLLWAALQEVLARLEEGASAVREVARPRVTVRTQMLRILALLQAAPEGVAFAQLFLYPERRHPLTRTEVILTFLAMLELIRLRRIQVRQPSLFGPIGLRLTNGHAG